MRMMIIYRRSPGTAGLRLHTLPFPSCHCAGTGQQEGAAEGARCPTLPSPLGSSASLPATALEPPLAITTLSPRSPARRKTRPPLPEPARKAQLDAQAEDSGVSLQVPFTGVPRRDAREVGGQKQGKPLQESCQVQGKGIFPARKGLGSPCKGTAKEVSLMLGGRWEEKVWAGPCPMGMGMLQHRERAGKPKLAPACAWKPRHVPYRHRRETTSHWGWGHVGRSCPKPPPPGLLARPSTLGHGYHRCSAPPLPSEPCCPLPPPQSPAGGPTGCGGADPLPRACVTILRFSKTKSLFSRKANTGLRLRAAFFQQLAPDFCLELQAQRACLGCRQTRLIIFLGK